MELPKKTIISPEDRRAAVKAFNRTLSPYDEPDQTGDLTMATMLMSEPVARLMSICRSIQTKLGYAYEELLINIAVLNKSLRVSVAKKGHTTDITIIKGDLTIEVHSQSQWNTKNAVASKAIKKAAADNSQIQLVAIVQNDRPGLKRKTAKRRKPVPENFWSKTGTDLFAWLTDGDYGLYDEIRVEIEEWSAKNKRTIGEIRAMQNECVVAAYDLLTPKEIAEAHERLRVHRHDEPRKLF
jgi:hypothetical protein